VSSSTRRQFLQRSASAGFTVAAARLSKADGAGDQKQPAGTPNVLLIMTDTQRKDDMGAYGNAAIKTPHLDSLATGGVMFQNCFTQYPACMPARATVFTGRYPMAHGVWSNGVPLPKTETTIAHAFAENGYRTGGAGKFHFLPHFPYRANPLPTMETHPEPFYGFQEFHLGEDGRSGEHWQWIEKHYPEHTDKPDHQIPVELHNSYWSASHTIEFIRDCAENGQPFFAFCSFVDPHQPYNPPSPYSTMYDEYAMPKPVRKEGELDRSRFKALSQSRNMSRYTDRTAYHRAQHYGEMTFIDDSVGRIIETLDSLQVRDNTLIVFVADHGDMLGDHWLWWKGPYHYSGCCNVPLFFNWPDMLKEGKIVDGLVQQTDIFPTIMDLVGLPIPAAVQGRSLEPVLTTDAIDTGYETVYMESVDSGAYHPEFFGGAGNRRPPESDNPVDTITIRSRRWRLTYFTRLNTGELFDLQSDPNEFVNRWDDPAYARVRGKLLLELLNRMASTRDPLPFRTRPY